MLEVKSFWIICILSGCWLTQDKDEFKAALAAYSSENYAAAAEIAQKLLPRANASLRAQSLLLSANCYAKSGETEKLVTALELFCSEFPERKEHRLAANNLALACRKQATTTGSVTDYAKAARWLTYLLEDPANCNAQLFFALGDSYARCAELEKACQAFQQLLDKFPDDPLGTSVHYELARIHDQQGQPQVAIACLTKFVESCSDTDSRLDSARHRLAMLLGQNSQTEKALELWVLVAQCSQPALVNFAVQDAARLALDSKSAEHLEMAAQIIDFASKHTEAPVSENILWVKSAVLANMPNKLKDALDLYEQLARSSATEERRAMSLLNASILASRLKDHERSADNAIQLMRANATNDFGRKAQQLLASSSQSFLAQKDYTRYLKYTSQLSVADLRTLKILNQRVQILLLEQQWQEIVDDTENLAPDFADVNGFVEVMLARATALSKLGRVQTAIEGLRHVLQVASPSKHSDVEYLLLNLEERTSSSNLESLACAFENFSQEHSNDPRAKGAIYRAGELYRQARKPSMAAAQFEKVYAADGKPGNDDLSQSAGILYARSLLELPGRRDDAMAVCQQLQNNQPSQETLAWCHFLIGEDLMLQRKFTESSQRFLLATETANPDLCGAAWYQHGLCLAQLGDKSGAVSALEKVLNQRCGLHGEATKRIQLLKRQLKID